MAAERQATFGPAVLRGGTGRRGCAGRRHRRRGAAPRSKRGPSRRSCVRVAPTVTSRVEQLALRECRAPECRPHTTCKHSWPMPKMELHIKRWPAGQPHITNALWHCSIEAARHPSSYHYTCVPHFSAPLASCYGRCAGSRSLLATHPLVAATLLTSSKNNLKTNINSD